MGTIGENFDRRFFLSRGALVAGAAFVGSSSLALASNGRQTKADKKVKSSTPGPPTTTTTTVAPTTTTTTTTTLAPTSSTSTTTPVEPPTAPSEGSGLSRWTDPATWGGVVPTETSWVSIDRPVLLDADVVVRGVAIQPGGSLVFEPTVSRTLVSTANVVVLGLLQMRPASADINHTLRFAEVDESAFVGGGMAVLDSDVGLWCIQAGVLDIAGHPKLAWARSAGSVAPGATSIKLHVDPHGWQVGDEVVVTPTLGPDNSNHFGAYDNAIVASINGRTIGLSTPTKFAHPEVDVGGGIRLGAEVLNLTRNARLEGTAAGRAHIFLMPTVPQQISHTTIRHMGPRQPTGERDFTQSVLGRYGLHFHHGYDGTRGSGIHGVVIRDCGAHAFVAHESHGITFDSCISHDTFDDAYWWDPRPAQREAAPKSHDIIYQSCVASLVKSDPVSRGFRLCGFNLREGDNCAVLDCVAVGVGGNNSASGFQWPEGADSIWNFKRCISHNNRIHGIFTWQNTRTEHVVEDFICYHNGGFGVSHGAYLTSYLYRNGILYGNGLAGLGLHAHSFLVRSQRFERLLIDCAGLSDHAVTTLKHHQEPSERSVLVSCEFRGMRKQAAAMYGGTASTTREWLDIIECQSTNEMLWFSSATLDGSEVRVQQEGQALLATVPGTPGEFLPAWNAVVNPIEPFAPSEQFRAFEPFPVAAAAASPS
jgi:hypothetical protein